MNRGFPFFPRKNQETAKAPYNALSILESRRAVGAFTRGNPPVVTPFRYPGRRSWARPATSWDDKVFYRDGGRNEDSECGIIRHAVAGIALCFCRAFQGVSPMNESILHVSDADFEAEVLQSAQPVLVDFWAEWCGPCRKISPLVDELAQDTRYCGKLKFAKLNVDESPTTPSNYGIRGIPTLILFKNGNAEATQVGALSKSELAAFIDSNL
jgi:thioredoxin 1